jgi:Suppressor of fused protein (SUFU)
MHVINYAHERDGVLYHGTLSDLDGVPKATWSYDVGGKRVTRDPPIDAATFRSLWNRIGSLDVFKRNRVRNPNQQLDPAGTHVIGIAFGDRDEPQQAQFAVPAAETHPQFRDWLKALNVPTPDAGPPPFPARKPAKPAKPADEDDPVIAAREQVYEGLFGDAWTVDRGDEEDGPAIDVYTFEPDDDRGRDFYTVVTGGMADERMRVPRKVECKRAELVMYVDKPTDVHVNLLRWLATLPHVQEGTWYGFGTTMNNGDPPQPIFDDSDLDCFLFLEPICSPDDSLGEQFDLDDDPVSLLWVVPITDAERHYIMDRDLSDFLKLLDQKGHSHILDEARRSYVRGR